MSFVVTTPELVTVAAGDLAGIGSTLREATATAAGSTTGVAAAASDEVSVAISELFGAYGKGFQSLSAQAAAFHDEFVSLLNGGAAAYLSTELTNAEQTLLTAANAPAQAVSGALAGTQGLLTPGAAAAAVPGGAYQQLFANTAVNLQSLFGNWAADPLPFLRQVLINQVGYVQQIATALAYTIENFPAILTNLPAAIQAGIQQLLSFNAAYYMQQFITTQIGFAQTFVMSLSDAVTGLVAGLPAFASGLQVAWQAVLAGNFYGAVVDVAQALGNLFVTGFNPGTPTITVTGGLLTPVVNATVNPTLLGPLGDFFTMMNIPGQEAQYFTNLMPPSILRQMSQNLTNVLNALSIPTISATATLPLTNPTAGSLSTFFGLPLVFSYAAMGAPIATLNGLATTATAVQQSLLAGDPLGALGALVDAPAVVTNGFLNSETLIDFTVAVPTGLPSPLPSTISIILHLPFDGILVPPHPVTATIDSGILPPTNVTIFGTPFMGMVPLLVNYLPQQLAAAIAPAG